MELNNLKAIVSLQFIKENIFIKMGLL